MYSQDHKTTATSTGHEGHEVHLCHICGWPFPNPHPSARHRRSHKKVCGTIEGYRIINSEEHERHLAVSDDEHASDEDEHTPSPNLVKKNTEGSGRVGEKSNKSEDDVYSDAVTDFSDSGISPRLEEHYESVTEVDKKSMEPKGVEGDQTADRTEQSDEPKKGEEITNPGPLANGTNLSEDIVPTSDTTGQAVPRRDADIQVQDDNLASVALDSEEGKVSDCTLTAVERQEEFCDKSVSDVVKHDLPPQTGTLQDSDASGGANSGAHSAERSTSSETVKIALADETREKEDDSVGFKEVSQFTEVIRPVGTNEVALVDETREKEDDSVGLKEVSRSTEEIRPFVTVGEDALPQQTLDATEHSDADLMVSSFDQEVKLKKSFDENAGSISASEREKCDVNGKENWSLVSKESFYFDTVPTFDSIDNTPVPEDDQATRAFKKDVDHCDEKSGSKHLETGNEKSVAASVEGQVTPDSTVVSDKTTDFLSSCAVETDARNSEVLSNNESRDDGSGGIGSELNHDIGDVTCKNSSPTASLDVTDNIHVTQNVDRVESVGVVESVSESKYNNEVCASEKTPEQSIPKEPTSLSTDSELLIGNSTNDGAKASESIDTAHETAKLDHKVNLASSREISESKCLDATSPGVDESHSSQDFNPSKSVGIVSSAELDGNFLVSEIGLITLSSKEAVPPPSDHETSATGDDKTVVNVEDVDSKSLQAEVDDKLTKENCGVSAINLSGSSSDRADSMDANCGSVVSDTPETISHKPKTTTGEARPDKSDTFELPSFMTLVQPGGEAEHDKAATEIETVQNNQQPKSDALQAGWFPSLTNVVNESEGRKKNEEIIAKVTNWSPVKQHHGPLKTLLNEVKSPNTKQVGSESKDNNGGATTMGPVTKDQDTNKDAEEWNSPARYPIEIKKEKKKGRSYWVPFVCCTSVHRDL